MNRLLPDTPNTTGKEIFPLFFVLHYTALDFESTVRRFEDSNPPVSAHFVIDVSGRIAEFRPCVGREGVPEKLTIREAYHCGESRHELDGKIYTSLNGQSVGIELVNSNGNLFEYSKAQYAMLAEILLELNRAFPLDGHLAKSVDLDRRVLGHEHVAGFRGKIDPGEKFDYAHLARLLGLPPESTLANMKPVLGGFMEPRIRSSPIAMAFMEKGDWANLSLWCEEQAAVEVKRLADVPS